MLLFAVVMDWTKHPPLCLSQLDCTYGGVSSKVPDDLTFDAATKALTTATEDLRALEREIALVERAASSWQNQTARAMTGAPTAVDALYEYATALQDQYEERMMAADTAVKVVAGREVRGVAADVWLMQQRGPSFDNWRQGGDQGGDPLLLDLSGRGVQLTNLEEGVMFDLDGNGAAEKVSWTKVVGEGGKDTASWLVRDDRFDGGAAGIQSGRELFGDQHGDVNGFERLRHFDDNGDGVLDRNDAAYSQLQLWQDRNHDGRADADELVSLGQAKVDRIELDTVEPASDIQSDEHGNRIQTGSFVMRR